VPKTNYTLITSGVDNYRKVTKNSVIKRFRVKPRVLQLFSIRPAVGAHPLLPVCHDGRLVGKGEHHSVQRVAEGVDRWKTSGSSTWQCVTDNNWRWEEGIFVRVDTRDVKASLASRPKFWPRPHNLWPRPQDPLASASSIWSRPRTLIFNFKEPGVLSFRNML